MKRPRKIFIAAILFLLFAASCEKQHVPQAKPEEVEMSATHLKIIDKIVKEAIKNRDFPGAVIVVGRKGKIVIRKAYGESQLVPKRRPMEVSMIFDIASITKPVATATAIMILAEQGKVSLWDRVKDYVHGFAPFIDENGTPGEDARLWHLLTHTSGLPPYMDAAEVEKNYGSPCPIEKMVGHIAQLKKTDPPGKAFHYTCLGFITLAYIVKKATGETIAEFSEKNIFKPLRMKHTFFSPPKRLYNLCVPTEVVKGKPLIGIVHDPLARLLGGISGNAGLFSTADDLAIFAQMMLDKGEYKGVRILSPLTVERMTSVSPEVQFSGRGLGWDLNSSYATSGGDIFGPQSYGHTGFTGTSIWIDPETETFVIFLTNRVHPDVKGSIVSLRSRLANVVASSIIKK